MTAHLQTLTHGGLEEAQCSRRNDFRITQIVDLSVQVSRNETANKEVVRIIKNKVPLTGKSSTLLGVRIF